MAARRARAGMDAQRPARRGSAASGRLVPPTRPHRVMTPSIKDLYVYALSEGEGVGTAYEYYVKRRVMSPLLRRLKPGARILVAGLPEKYGTSLDFVLAGWERGARLLCADDRPEA